MRDKEFLEETGGRLPNFATTMSELAKADVYLFTSFNNNFGSLKFTNQRTKICVSGRANFNCRRKHLVLFGAFLLWIP